MSTIFTAMDGEGTASPGALEIRTASNSADWEIAHQMLDEEHFLGAGRETAFASLSLRTCDALHQRLIARREAIHQQGGLIRNFISKPAPATAM